MWVLRTHISITANTVSELPLIKYQCKVFVMKQKDLKKGNGFFVNVFAGSIVLSMQIMSIHMELKSQLKYVKNRV